MKNTIFATFLMIITSFNLSAYVPSSADNDLASAVISSEASVGHEVIKLFKSHLQNHDSKISQTLGSFRKELAPVNSLDLILIQQSIRGGITSATYLLPIKIISKSSIRTFKYIVVEYISDSNEEEINLSTKIYFTKFTNIEIKDQD